MAEASLPDIRARRRPGTAIAAMMPMIATTISSSMRVKPFAFFISTTPSKPVVNQGPSLGRRDTVEQPQCQANSDRAENHKRLYINYLLYLFTLSTCAIFGAFGRG